MKKSILTIVFALFTASYFCSAQVLFDPATVNPGSLPSGMSIDTVNGNIYLQVILNGYNSTLDIPATTIGTNQQLIGDFKYALGTLTADTLTLGDINGTVQIMDTVNKINNPYGSGMVPAFTVLQQIPVTGNWEHKSAPISSSVKIVHQIQFYGQVPSQSYSATTGDTMWVGKIRALTVSPYVVVDPMEYDTTALPGGMSIVNMNGTDYFQIILNGYNSTFMIPQVTLDSGMTVMCNIKYSLGGATDSTWALSDIQGVVQIMDTVNTVKNPYGSGRVPASTAMSQSPVTGNFGAISASVIDSEKYVHQVQVFGQVKSSGYAVTYGDTMWVSKITLADKMAPSMPGNLASSVDTTSVTLTWDASMDNVMVAGYIISQDSVVIDTVTTTKLTVKGLADGSYNFSVVAMDASGNMSTAATTTAQVGTPPSGLKNTLTQNVSIYPNPSGNGVVNIRLTGTAQTKLAIYDMNGKLVYENAAMTNNLTLSTSRFTPGVYYVKITDNNSTLVKKLIIK